MQEHKPACPSCGQRGDVVKDGMRGATQRFRCNACGKRFSQRSGSVLANSPAPDDVWLAVVSGMIGGWSVERIRRSASGMTVCKPLDWRTVWAMRQKVMEALDGALRPGLGGIVEFGSVFVRDAQKGARHLSSALPGDVSPRRPARKTSGRSLLGVNGGEYTTVTFAIDREGRCAFSLVGTGPLSERDVRALVAGWEQDVTIACSNASKPHARAFRKLGIRHYIEPGTMPAVAPAARVRAASKGLARNEDSDAGRPAGGAAASGRPGRMGAETRVRGEAAGAARAAGQGAVADALPADEELWRMGVAARIENCGPMSYGEFLREKRELGLSLARANELKSTVKALVGSRAAGVSTKYLKGYVAWVEYATNLSAELGRPLVAADAERILRDAIAAPARASAAAAPSRASGAAPAPSRAPAAAFGPAPAAVASGCPPAASAPSRMSAAAVSARPPAASAASRASGAAEPGCPSAAAAPSRASAAAPAPSRAPAAASGPAPAASGGAGGLSVEEGDRGLAAYQLQLFEHTATMRRRCGNERFYFTDEDGVESFEAEYIAGELPYAVLASIAESLGIEGARHLDRVSLVAAVAQMGEGVVDELLYRSIPDARTRSGDGA